MKESKNRGLEENMDNKKMGKFEIDIEIKDLLWEFARRWRLILIMTVLCGIALGAYQYQSDMNKTVVVAVKKTQEELEKSMGKQDLGEVASAVALYRQLEQKANYLEESVLMRINPFEENAVILQYYVDSEVDNIATSANDAYVAYVDSGLIAQNIVKTDGYVLESMYLGELIAVVKDNGGVYVNAADATESINLRIEGTSDERIFTVKVVGETIEAAEVLANDVKTSITAYNTILKEKIGEHEVQLVEENRGVMADQALAELQNWNATSAKTISNNLDKMKNEMTGDQISLFVYRTTVLAEENKIETNTTTATEKVVTISMKHVIIGAVVGFILGCGMAFVFYLFAPALRSAEEIQTLYGVRVLGTIDDSEFQKKKLFAVVDKLIKKLQNGRKRTFTFEQEVQMVCAKIILDCKKNGQNEVVLTSSVAGRLPVEVVHAIVAKCEEKGVRVLAVGEMFNYDAEIIEDVSQNKMVVFVEKKRVSLYDELYSEIALCKEQDIAVSGIVVLG